MQDGQGLVVTENSSWGHSHKKFGNSWPTVYFIFWQVNVIAGIQNDLIVE